MRNSKIVTDNLVFNGFTEATLQFLIEIKENNSKTWYEEHKSQYQAQVLQPMQALVAELGRFMLEIDPLFEITPAVDKTISRIYRDTRFSKDKSLYRDNIWLTFKRPSKSWLEAPSFYFEIFPNYYRYGMGFYTASKATMDRFRAMIDENPEHFLNVISFYQTGCFALEGESYKKLLTQKHPQEILSWYQRKTFYLACNRDIDAKLFCRELIDELKEGFHMLVPLYNYLWDAKNSADSATLGLKNTAIFNSFQE